MSGVAVQQLPGMAFFLLNATREGALKKNWTSHSLAKKKFLALRNVIPVACAYFYLFTPDLTSGRMTIRPSWPFCLAPGDVDCRPEEQVFFFFWLPFTNAFPILSIAGMAVGGLGEKRERSFVSLDNRQTRQTLVKPPRHIGIALGGSQGGGSSASTATQCRPLGFCAELRSQWSVLLK